LAVVRRWFGAGFDCWWDLVNGGPLKFALYEIKTFFEKVSKKVLTLFEMKI
jgi:hypothetical protein